VSRLAPRFRAHLTVTISPMTGGGELYVCHTRDISDAGMWLHTEVPFELGARLWISLLDRDRGEAVEITGEVIRAGKAGCGIRVLDPGDAWLAIVAAAGRRTAPPETPPRRLRVLVVGDEHRQRGALALYVTSGWDVRFATDLESATEALRGFAVDAAIAEFDGDDPRWAMVLAQVRATAPEARRLVRGAVAGEADDPLVHRFVSRDAGLEALLDALRTDLPGAP
jgi:hypothetical protein